MKATEMLLMGLWHGTTSETLIRSWWNNPDKFFNRLCFSGRLFSFGSIASFILIDFVVLCVFFFMGMDSWIILLSTSMGSLSLVIIYNFFIRLSLAREVGRHFYDCYVLKHSFDQYFHDSTADKKYKDKIMSVDSVPVLSDLAKKTLARTAYWIRRYEVQGDSMSDDAQDCRRRLKEQVDSFLRFKLIESGDYSPFFKAGNERVKKEIVEGKITI